MKDREILSVESDGTKVCIVDNMLFIGSSDDDSEHPDTVIHWKNDQIMIEGWEITPAMLFIIKQYIDKNI